MKLKWDESLQIGHKSIEYNKIDPSKSIQALLDSFLLLRIIVYV